MSARIDVSSDISALASKSAEAYDLLAREYYERQKHPTCANFAALHAVALDMIGSRVRPGERYLEVGCGMGQLDLVASPYDVVLTDVSEGMLSLARRRTGGLVVCRKMNAFEPDFPACTFAGVACFLADPYNHELFYRAIRNVLKTSGFLLVTVPNHVWASALRRRLNIPLEQTIFIVHGQHTLAVPSITRPVKEQLSLLSRSGYDVVFSTTMNLSVVRGSTPSHHVRFAAEELALDATTVPLLDLYVAIKNRV